METRLAPEPKTTAVLSWHQPGKAEKLRLVLSILLHIHFAEVLTNPLPWLEQTLDQTHLSSSAVFRGKNRCPPV